MNQQTAGNEGLAHLAWVFGNGWTASDVGPAMSCMEADAITAALARARYIDEAEVWLRGHAAADNEEQDTHWGMPQEALRDYSHNWILSRSRAMQRTGRRARRAWPRWPWPFPRRAGCGWRSTHLPRCSACLPAR